MERTGDRRVVVWAVVDTRSRGRKEVLPWEAEITKKRADDRAEGMNDGYAEPRWIVVRCEGKVKP